MMAAWRGLLLAGERLAKSAGTVSYALSGRLYLSGGRLVIGVPRALIAGAAKALAELGAELPPDDQLGRIEVFSSDEVNSIGADRITERGKTYRYTLGRLYATDKPEGAWNRVWYIRIHSPELQALRRSYGLTPLPDSDGFHFLVAVRRRGVLGRNDISKADD